MNKYSIADDLHQEITRVKYLSESLQVLCKHDRPFTYLGFELGRDVSVLDDIHYKLGVLLKRIEESDTVESQIK